ncbi:Protein of unknown function [Pyronema omphalodes CBS 100304]|uniref:Uncharacterized protein n=1 Tax=Pyronema omphalodes (strain CBS 100304) TaxID=1076935 RepID=U4LKT9_PYROM|nr:Protein of unknown function [Pyronema omphalodes CBS 100304]
MISRLRTQCAVVEPQANHKVSPSTI